MYKYFKYILILLFLQLSITVVAQKYTISTRVVDRKDGVLGGRIKSLLQDRAGFVWMLTQTGVGRYDGHQFQWWTPTNSEMRELPSTTMPIVEDDEGYLWIIGASSIDLLHHKTLEIISLEDKIKEKIPFEGAINAIKRSPDGQLVFKVTQNEKWYKYHSQTGLVELPFLNKNHICFSVLENGIACFSHTKEKNFIKIDLKTGKKIKEIPLEKGYGSYTYIHHSSSDKDLFWSTSDYKTLQIYEASDSNLTKLVQFEASQAVYKKSTHLYYLKDKNLLVASFDIKNKGLSIIDLDKKRLIPIEQSNSNEANRFTSFGSSIVTSDDVLLTIMRKGIRISQIQETHFSHYPPYKSIRGIGLADNALFVQKLKIPLDNPDAIQESKRKRYYISAENTVKDEFWLGGVYGIGQIDAATNTVIKQVGSEYPNRNRIWSFLRNQKGRWWAGTQYHGLMATKSPLHDTLYSYDKYNNFTELENKRIHHLVEDGEYLWAASNVGLYLVHQEKGVLHRYYPYSENAYQIPSSNIHFIYKDKKKTFWVASASEGLFRFKVNEAFEIVDFKKYHTENGLSSDVVYCIVEDEKERLWISTLNGISCLNKKTDEITTFNQKDGIKELEFNRMSFAQSENGRIYFGSLEGVIGFHPEELLKPKTYDLPIKIARFGVYNKERQAFIDETLKVQKSREIILKPSEQLFRLNVTMQDYFNANYVRYSYKIEDLFDNYQQIEGNTIEIGSLPYGHYTLEIRGQGAGNRYSSQELTISLIITRPFYLRWWFILFSLVIIIISLFQAYQWRVRQLEERKKELELLVQERTAQIRKDKAIIEKDKIIIEEQAMQLKELDELKSKFFANISHELRTPLTLILSPLNRYISKNNYNNEDFTMLQMMQQNGKKLLKRINELLDLSRLDANRLEVRATPTFLYPFCKTLLSTFEGAANLKGIQLLFKYQLDENIQVKIDDDKVEKIVSNYLSNALKFTPKKGEIELHISKKVDKLQIRVRDTGIGILPNDLIKIFDRFYQTKKEDQQQGTGIGLSLCQELAKVLNGRVWATSEIGKGSIFTLELPLVETFAQMETIPKEDQIIVPVIEKVITEKPIHHQFRPDILIVEDNADLRNYLLMILKEDYNVKIAENGKEALKQLSAGTHEVADASTDDEQTLLLTKNNTTKNSLPSLIISDIMMPVMDGIELLTKVKSSKEWQHIPMIILTARQSVEAKIDALRIGVDDYLTKPFLEKELKARVANLIKNSESRTTNLEFPTKQKPLKPISSADLIWLKKLEQIIIKNVSKSSFKLTDAATEMNISYRRLQQKLKEITGLSPKKYQRNIKLSKARSLLKSGEVTTVQEVMYQIGFENYTHFVRIYKTEFGIKPIEELKS